MIPSLPNFLAARPAKIKVLKHEDMGLWMRGNGEWFWIDVLHLADGRKVEVLWDKRSADLARDACQERFENFRKKTEPLNIDLEDLLDRKARGKA